MTDQQLSNDQINILKNKVIQLGQRHRTVVTALKKDFKNILTKSSQTLTETRSKAAQLELELKEERKKNYELGKRVQEVEGTDSHEEIIKLKNSLNEEIHKSTELTNQLKRAAIQDSDIQSMKEAAYSKAKIDRLQEDIKQEIARNARLRNESEEEVRELKKEFKKQYEISEDSLNNAKKKIKQLEEELKITTEKAESDTIDIEEKKRKLDIESSELEKAIEDKDITIKNQTEDISNKTSEISDLKQNIADMEKDHEENIENQNGLVREQENEISRLNLLTNRYDLITMGREVAVIREVVQSLLRRGTQQEFVASLKETISIRKKLKRNIEKINELTLNYHQKVSEAEDQLRNHIYMEETTTK